MCPSGFGSATRWCVRRSTSPVPREPAWSVTSGPRRWKRRERRRSRGRTTSCIRHVREMRHSGRRRQHLACHRFADVPDFKIDDTPEYQTGFTRKLERRPIDDGRIMRTRARQHWSARRFFLAPFHVLGHSPELGVASRNPPYGEIAAERGAKVTKLKTTRLPGMPVGIPTRPGKRRPEPLTGRRIVQSHPR